MTTATLRSEHTLAELARTLPAATRVFHRHGLDFCCHGDKSLREACEEAGLEVRGVIDELQREAPPEGFIRWDEAPLPSILDHILSRFHEGHRAEVPRLLELARKVERVHADKASCPRGLAAHLEHVRDALEEHMQKEEQILFPLIAAGRGREAIAPVRVMEQEHREHAENLTRLRELAGGYVPPEEACESWRALYLGLAQLEFELMQHIHLENYVLFPRALRE